MYAKFGNIYVCSDVSEVPLLELKVGSHIVLLEKSSLYDEVHDEKEVEQVVSMVLHRKRHDRFFSFNCLSTYASVYQTYGIEDIVDKYGCVEEVQGHNARDYILLPNGKPFMVPCARTDSRLHNDTFIEKSVDEIKNSSQHIYKLIENLYKSKSIKSDAHASFYSCDLKSIGYAYLVLPFAEDLHVLLAASVKVHSNGYKLWRDIDFAVLTPTHVHRIAYDPGRQFFVELTDAYLKSMEYVSEMHREEDKKNVERFMEVLQLLYMNPITIRKGQNLTKLENCLDRMIPYSSPMTLFKHPFYVNENMDVKAYPSIFDDKFVLQHDGNFHTVYLEYKFPYLKNEFRKISAVFNFLMNGRNGIDPKDGNMYKDGELVEDENIYKSSLGIRVYNPYSPNYHIVCDGYYVPAHSYEDGDIISRIEGEYKLFQQLQEQ